MSHDKHTICLRVWLNAVNNVRVTIKHVDNSPCPLVPNKDPPAVATTQDPVVTPEVSLLDLRVCVCVYECVCVCGGGGWVGVSTELP